MLSISSIATPLTPNDSSGLWLLTVVVQIKLNFRTDVLGPSILIVIQEGEIHTGRGRDEVLVSTQKYSGAVYVSTRELSYGSDDGGGDDLLVVLVNLQQVAGQSEGHSGSARHGLGVGQVAEGVLESGHGEAGVRYSIVTFSVKRLGSKDKSFVLDLVESAGGKYAHIPGLPS